MDSSSTVKTPKIVKLKPIEATPASFSEFGQVVSSSPDGQEFGPHDAQLELHRGTPRFYIMHLEDRELKFSKITHHASVTQCLGSIGGEEWYLGVAKASIVQRTEIDDEDGTKRLQSACGHYYIPPHPDDVRVFKITGPKFLKLNVGTWHAGPLFKTRTMDFYNLELSNTNVVDHTTYNFSSKDGVVFWCAIATGELAWSSAMGSMPAPSPPIVNLEDRREVEDLDSPDVVPETQPDRGQDESPPATVTPCRRRSTIPEPPDSRRKKKAANDEYSQQLSRLVDAVTVRSTASSSRAPVDPYSIAACLKVLNEMAGVPRGGSLYVTAVNHLMNPVAREMFIELGDDEVRYQVLISLPPVGGAK